MPAYFLPVLALGLVLLQLRFAFGSEIRRFYLSFIPLISAWASGVIFGYSLLFGCLGGGISAFLVSLFLRERRGIFLLELATALGIAIALLKLGCFLKGCCFGSPTSLPIGISFAPDTPAYSRYGAQPLHPIQLYETAIGVSMFILGTKSYLRQKFRYLTLAFFISIVYLSFKLFIRIML